MAANSTPRSELGRMVDVVAALRQAAAKLEPGDEWALWAAIAAMATTKLEQMDRKRERRAS